MVRHLAIIVLVLGCSKDKSGGTAAKPCGKELPQLGAALEIVLTNPGDAEMEARIGAFAKATSSFARSSACPPDVGEWVKRWEAHMRATLSISGRAEDLKAKMLATAEASRALIPQMSSPKDIERLRPEMEKLKSESAGLDAEMGKLAPEAEQLGKQRADLLDALETFAAREGWVPTASVASAIEKSKFAR